MILGILGWLIVGLIVGFVASKVINLRGDDPKLGTAAACGGALVMGVLYTLISGVAVRPWNIWSLLSALIGAVVAVAVWHGVRARFVSHDVQTVRRSY
jgi:uncharacterized membrane protein YeaQ/YmgE (transglycosylase-associated protein family)